MSCYTFVLFFYSASGQISFSLTSTHYTYEGFFLNAGSQFWISLRQPVNTPAKQNKIKSGK
jgi:hypothetical protein